MLSAICLVDASKHLILILHCVHPQIEFLLVSLWWPQASSPLSDSTKACFSFICKRPARQRSWQDPFNAGSRSVRFPLAALGCPSLTSDGKGPRSPNSWDRQHLSKRKETSAVSYIFAQMWLHLVSGEFPHCAWWIQGGSVVSLVQDGGGSLTASTKTVFLTQRREASKTGGERRSRLPSRSLSKCRELYLSEGMIRLYRTLSSE